MNFEQCVPAQESESPKIYERKETKDIYQDDELEEILQNIYNSYSENNDIKFQEQLIHMINIQRSHYIPFLTCFKEYIYNIFLEILQNEDSDKNLWILILTVILELVDQEDCEYRLMFSANEYLEFFIIHGINSSDAIRIICIGILSFISNNNEAVSTEILNICGLDLVSSIILANVSDPNLMRKALNIFCNLSKFIPDELFQDALQIIRHLLSNEIDSIWAIIFGTNLITSEERALEIAQLPQLGNAINLGLNSFNDGEVSLFLYTLYYYIDDQIPDFDEQCLLDNLPEDVDGTTYQALGNMLTHPDTTQRFFTYPDFFERLILPFNDATYVIQCKIIDCIYNLFQTGELYNLRSCISDSFINILVSALNLENSETLSKVLSIMTSILQFSGVDQLLIQCLDENSFDLILDSDNTDLIDMYDNLCELYPTVFAIE